MYNNSSQYASGGYQDYSQYQQGYSNYDYQGYQEYNQATHAGPDNNWNGPSYTSPNDPVAQEMQQQKAQLIKQRDDYVKKVSVLRHELEQLRVQKRQLSSSEARSSNRDFANIVKQNDKLQEEIQGKMKAILNVIEMLSSIIKDEKSVSDLEASISLHENEVDSHSPPPPPVDSGVLQRRQHLGAAADSRNTKYCYVHYDAGLHWCRTCDEFPESAKDFLTHLQEKKHMELAKENDVDNTPWHKLPCEEILPADGNLPKKRVPIKGLQFFISAPSWYCKLCDVWIGDLHCASHHLKSVAHFNNYENFIAQNPHWEMEWLKDREKAKSRSGNNNSSDSDSSKRMKRKRLALEALLLKEKKKRKRSKRKRRHSTDSSSSSSSSDSSSDDNTDRSKSIRVAMRNRKVQSIMDEDLAKWSVLEKIVEEHKRTEKDAQEKVEIEDKKEDTLINQWMTVSQPQDNDKILLEGLRDRMRQKQVVEKAKMVEIEHRRVEKEKVEKEMQERREKALRIAKEEEQRERDRREKEETERLRNRAQIKFKTNYRRKGSPGSDREESNESYNRERSQRDSESRSHSGRRSKSRSNSEERKTGEYQEKKKPQTQPGGKKLPFIGRMPLFKNKKPSEEKEEKKEIKKQSYEIPRRTRFQPGNLAKAFIPKPDVVCFPKLSSIPPLTLPPPPTITEQNPPAPPKISKDEPQAPPPPKIDKTEDNSANLSDDEVLYADHGEGFNANMMSQYYQDYNYYSYSQEEVPPPPPHSYTMPLEPPPLPPDDDLAMLGICADDMAAQSF